MAMINLSQKILSLRVSLIKKREFCSREKCKISLEQEITEILRLVLSENHQNPINLATIIENRFANFENLELPEIEREAIRTVSIFAE
jgi:hypothetical protein